MFLLTGLSLLIPIMLLALNLLLYKKFFMYRNKPSSFECGFDTKIFPRIPFSLKFYLISVIFLIFDIEIALILPIPPILHLSLSSNTNSMATVFILILLIGILAEWKEGALTWLS